MPARLNIQRGWNMPQFELGEVCTYISWEKTDFTRYHGGDCTITGAYALYETKRSKKLGQKKVWGYLIEFPDLKRYNNLLIFAHPRNLRKKPPPGVPDWNRLAGVDKPRILKAKDVFEHEI